MEAISSAPFHVTLTRLGTCTSDGLIDYLWPAGYRVRFDPTVLLDPTGKIVAHQGQYVTVGGGIVGTASWPTRHAVTREAMFGPFRVLSRWADRG